MAESIKIELEKSKRTMEYLKVHSQSESFIYVTPFLEMVEHIEGHESTKK